jgi:hypothetical protein
VRDGNKHHRHGVFAQFLTTALQSLEAGVEVLCSTSPTAPLNQAQRDAGQAMSEEAAWIAHAGQQCVQWRDDVRLLEGLVAQLCSQQVRVCARAALRLETSITPCALMMRGALRCCVAACAAMQVVQRVGRIASLRALEQHEQLLALCLKAVDMALAAASQWWGQIAASDCATSSRAARAKQLPLGQCRQLTQSGLLAALPAIAQARASALHAAFEDATGGSRRWQRALEGASSLLMIGCHTQHYFDTAAPGGCLRSNAVAALLQPMARLALAVLRLIGRQTDAAAAAAPAPGSSAEVSAAALLAGFRATRLCCCLVAACAAASAAAADAAPAGAAQPAQQPWQHLPHASQVFLRSPEAVRVMAAALAYNRCTVLVCEAIEGTPGCLTQQDLQQAQHPPVSSEALAALAWRIAHRRQFRQACGYMGQPVIAELLQQVVGCSVAQLSCLHVWAMLPSCASALQQHQGNPPSELQGARQRFGEVAFHVCTTYRVLTRASRRRRGSAGRGRRPAGAAAGAAAGAGRQCVQQCRRRQGSSG